MLETAIKGAQMVDLDFKAAIINMFNELKKIMLKE